MTQNNDLPGPDQLTALEFDELFRIGTELLHRGKAADAVPLLERAHELRPDDVDAGINLAGAYILTKKFKKAATILQPLSETNPNHPMIWINLGAAYLANPVLASDEEQMKALAAFQHALEIDPIAPSVAYNIGLIYRDRGQYDEAIEWFEKAVQHNPRDQHARNILAQLQTAQDSKQPAENGGS